MKKHRDLTHILRSNKMRITAGRKLLLQFILDHKNSQLSLGEIHDFFDRTRTPPDRSSVYRNLETFKRLDIIQELNLPGKGKRFQYVFDRKVHHFYICKACGRSSRGNERLFKKIESALKEVHGFAKANLSVVFYGFCAKCTASR